ncbi:MAG: patatin-like phospholipase family protein [Hyphomicrobiales bacterium]|uniref:patatin-like phospholipase family protein n=1 Tax=Rhabdaerophilum calidifontis TaxID=2604328 RepID=UPI00123C16C7|nr:patatin-like phospholipase family protein [Rhabdaerophilum calidifontis]MCA1998833.1 patatin-like phospholipase family protein [Hyphomicrobiales bacterium]
MAAGQRSKRTGPVDGIKPINIALQGGGAHGAFTWGVLDAILEDERLAIRALSGASAGAMNAVCLVEGYAEGGRQGARDQLRRFWERVSDGARYSPIQRSLFDRLLGRWGIEQTPGFLWFEWLSHVVSPYETNPLDLNPLRDVLNAEIDFTRVRGCANIRLFIAATNVHTGRIEVFDQKKLTAEHVLASACLPSIFRAIEIDGVPYWDGGYTGNPALFPLFHATESADLLIVQLTRMIRRELPTTARAIENRLNEITFNASLLGELRAIEFVQRLIEGGMVPADRYRRLRLHRIDADKALADLDASSKINAERDFIETLFERGRKAGRDWLRRHYDDIGRRDTLDLAGILAGRANGG